MNRLRLRRFSSGLLILVFLLPLQAGDADDAVMRYLVMKEKYQKWREGLFGSRHVRERELRLFMNENMGKVFRTDHIFTVEPTAQGDNLVIRQRTDFTSWLEIRGQVSPDSLKGMEEKESALYRNWRGTDLLAVEGTLRRFYLQGSYQSARVILILRDIRIIPAEKHP